MNYSNLIDSGQAHLPVQYASNIYSFARSDTGVVIDSEPHPNHMCKTSFLLAPLAVRVHDGCSAFPFYTPTKPLILYDYIVIQNCFISKIINNLYT